MACTMVVANIAKDKEREECERDQRVVVSRDEWVNGTFGVNTVSRILSHTVMNDLGLRDRVQHARMLGYVLVIGV